jgi:hypothetical protein
LGKELEESGFPPPGKTLIQQRQKPRPTLRDTNK